MFVDVSSGDRLSGHKQPGCSEYPTISVHDGQGPGGGSLMFSIECFHWASVVKKKNKTELWFENKVCLSTDGVVTYDDGNWSESGLEIKEPAETLEKPPQKSMEEEGRPKWLCCPHIDEVHEYTSRRIWFKNDDEECWIPAAVCAECLVKELTPYDVCAGEGPIPEGLARLIARNKDERA